MRRITHRPTRYLRRWCVLRYVRAAKSPHPTTHRHQGLSQRTHEPHSARSFGARALPHKAPLTSTVESLGAFWTSPWQPIAGTAQGKAAILEPLLHPPSARFPMNPRGESRGHLLTVLHAAEPTGPPLFALQFLRWLREHHPGWRTSTLLTDAGGGLDAEFAELGPVVFAGPARALRRRPSPSSPSARTPAAPRHPGQARRARPHRPLARPLCRFHAGVPGATRGSGPLPPPRTRRGPRAPPRPTRSGTPPGCRSLRRRVRCGPRRLPLPVPGGPGAS